MVYHMLPNFPLQWLPKIWRFEVCLCYEFAIRRSHDPPANKHLDTKICRNIHNSLVRNLKA